MFEKQAKMRRLWCGIKLVALLLIASCSFVTPPPPSPVTLPQTFSFTGEQALSDRWWESFADPELDQLITKALGGNFNLQIVWDRLDQSQALARKTGADLSPTLAIEGRTARSWAQGSGADSTTSNSTLGLAAGYELDLWGRVRSRNDAARLDLQSRVEDLHAAGLTLSAQVASTWYQLTEQAGQIKLLEEQIETNSKALELITLRFRTGKIGIADVLQQRQLIENNRGEMTQVLTRLQFLEHQLSILFGATPEQPIATPGTEFKNLPALPSAGTPANMVLRRPDIRGAWNQIRAADYRVAEAVADRFPRIALTGRVETSGTDSSTLFNNWLSTLAANLVGPIFDGGKRSAEVDRAEAFAAEALHHYGQVVLEAFVEVEDALIQERHQRQYIDSLDRQLALAKQSIETIRDRYLNGTENYQRVLTTLLSYQNLQRKRLTAQRELVEFRINLCRSLGGSWEMHRSETNKI